MRAFNKWCLHDQQANDIIESDLLKTNIPILSEEGKLTDDKLDYNQGVSLNIMVLFSLVLALGMLVDNGIVVVENVYRLMDEGLDSFEATKKGIGEVAWPIIASTSLFVYYN
ncbi:efflux RND transporter permease subunit, partial [bacterium]|nr:efflux RND transporter permease subunit [bacterium]